MAVRGSVRSDQRTPHAAVWGYDAQRRRSAMIVQRNSWRGTVLVLSLFAVGGAMLWGLFAAPHAVSPPAPRDASWGVPPERSLRVVSYNILHNQRGIERVA